MSILDKLCIRGIRSFGPNDEEKVKFSTPLTLFLGQNGCGKTTIIECLKYGLTGELPGGSDSGRGFVNDPKLSNKSNTKGYVKLRFKDTKGEFITVGKFLEVSTQAGGKLKFKRLNPTIRREDGNGAVEDIAGRCFDIDLYCAQKLNVSKAIINNVIFCHQENSAWPLDEAKKLKEKFDDIFGSTEYNKCVERLRKLIRDKKNHIKILKEQFELKRMAKRSTEKLKESLSDKETQLEHIQRTIEEKQEEIVPLQRKLDKINELVDSLSTTHQKLTGLETTLKGVLEQQEAIKKHLVEEYEGTDEELESEILNFSKFQEIAKNEILGIEEKKGTIDSKIQEINQVIQKRQISFGQLKQEEAQHKKRCEELTNLVEKAKAKFDITTEEDESVPDILYKLNTTFKRYEQKFNEYRITVERNEKQLQTAIDNIRDKFAAAKESYSSKTKLIAETNRKIQETKLKLGTLSQSDIKLESLEKKITEAEQVLAKKKSEFDEEAETQQLEQLDAQITQKEQTQSQLDREHRILQQNYVTEQKIDSEKTLVIEKKAEIANLKQKHEQHFETLFTQEVPQDKYEKSVQAIQKREADKVKTLTKSITNCERKIASLEASVKHATEKLQHHQNELAQDKTKIENVCKGREFADLLKESYAKKEKLQKEKGAYRSAKTLFEQFISQFEKDSPCCPVCATDFSSNSSVVPNIIATLKRKIEDLPRKLTETESQLKKEEELYNRLQQLKHVNENIQIIEEAVLPLLEEELQQNKEKLDETKMELVSLKNDLVTPQNLVETCMKVLSDAALLDRLDQELKRTDINLESLKEDLVTVSSNRTLDETETELSRVKADLSYLRKQYKTKRDLHDQTKASIQKLNARLQQETQRKLEMQKLLQERPLLEKQIKEYKETTDQLEKEKNSLVETLASLESELADAEQNRNKAVKDHKKKIEEDRLELDTRKRLIDDVGKVHQTIQTYEAGDSKAKLEVILNELDDCKSNIIKLEDAKKALINAVMKKKEELASQESKFRSLNDNKDLRANRARSQELQKQIQDLQKQIGHHNSRSICEERRKVIDKIDMIQSEVNRKAGEQHTIKDWIRTNKLELNKKEHKESIHEFKKKYYELRVEELSMDDLSVYTEALEKSILKFHQERMVQINMTIRDLWRNIYKGNDIDYIEIQTDSDNIGGGVRRSYSYKVVQVKKGTELEMRGRCSAGQKVLACLVIRMALAETFSSNCGILALDEPTTNLDRDNIMSLSDALSRIITAREKQKSFQLLIITHDEEFLQSLTRDQSVSHYYRVQRNADGFSEIKKEVL